MKNQYFGDVSDLAKYALLRVLGATGLHCCVCWMLTPNDGRTDGRHISYLQHPRRFRHFDSEVFDALAEAVSAGRRDIAVVSERNLLPNTSFFGDVLLDDAKQRADYFTRLWRVAASNELLFFDPDNGLEVASVRRGRRGSARYLFLDELEDAFSRGHSPIVYQHYPRVARAQFAETIADRIFSTVGTKAIFLSAARVAFVVVPQEQHRATLELAIDQALPRLGTLVQSVQ